MIYGWLPGTPKGDLLIISDSVIKIREWAEDQDSNLIALRIFRPHEVIDLVEQDPLK